MQHEILNIVVLAGGTSDEREVSLRSGKSVLEALKTKGHNVRLYDVTSPDLPMAAIDKSEIAFPVLHGKGGEDGSLQAQLDGYGITYVGADTTASKLCFDKIAYREFLKTHQLPIADGQLVDAQTIWESPLITKPFVLKPYDGGSSIDNYILRDSSQLSRAIIEDIFTRHEKMLLEELIVGVEITVSVLGDEALPVIEIIPPSDSEFDYENKYNGATQELCPPQHVSEAAQAAARELAVKIHKLTGCRHYSRTDMIVTPNDDLVVLETNTLPGMTDQSLFPKAAATAGISMPELVDRLVQMAANS